IGMNERIGVQDAAVYMALRREVDHRINLMRAKHTAHRFAVGDVALLEAVIRLVADLYEVIEVACIGQLVVDDDVVFRVLLDHVADEGAADEPRATCYKDVFHSSFLSLFSLSTAGSGLPSSLPSLAAGRSTKRSIAS